MLHPEPLRLQACFDGELDTMATVEIEQHLQQCEDCRAQWQSLEALRDQLRHEVPRETAPAALRLQLDALLQQESDKSQAARGESGHAPGPESGPAPGSRPPSGRSRPRPAWLTASFWLGGLSGGAAVAAVAAMVAVMGWLPRSQPLQDELVGAYVRSMMSTHPIDVVSSDHHTVKPWFGGHADVSPVVEDFDAQGYRLIGGRADYLDHQRAAVMVYQHGAHLIDVFSWAVGARTLPASPTARDGYHIACWRAKDLNYCAISDTGRDELHALQALLQASIARDEPVG